MKRLLQVLAMAASLGAAAFGGYRYATTHPTTSATPTTATSGKTDGERKILYWYDPMYPQSRFDKPGKSPYMDMQLVPKYEDEQSPEPQR